MRLLQSTLASSHLRSASIERELHRRRATLLNIATLLAVTLLWLLLCACGLGAQQPNRFLAQRTSTTQSPAAALAQARAQHLQLLAHPRAANLTAAWQPLGPTSINSPTFGALTGRITSIALDPNDPTGNTVYLGTTGGGVWKSTNAAGPLASVTFTPLTDVLPVFSANTGGTAIPSLSIGAVAVQPATNPILLAGTGDPNDATDSYYGQGILRSTDQGLTWSLIQSSNDTTAGLHFFTGLSVAALAFSTTTPSLVVAAFSTSPLSTALDATAPGSVPGLYVSTDSGVTWQMAALYDGATLVQKPVPLGGVQAANPVTSVVWDAQRSRFFAAVRSHGYYSSPDGLTWTRLLNQPGANLTTANCPVGSTGQGSPNCPIFRGTLAVQPATGDLYALTVDANNLDQGLWQDLCNLAAGACTTPTPLFANRLDNGAFDSGNSNTILQGDYNLSLAAAPSSTGTTLYAGAIDLYRCTFASNATACTFRNTTNALNGCNAPAKVAPAQHALAASNPILFLGNDGGLWRSLDGVSETGSACASSDASHFDNLNPAIAAGGSLAEVIAFSNHPTDPDTLLAGLGANGAAATTTALTLTPWPQLSAGEGGYPAMDPTTPANWLLSIGAGINLKQCPNGSSCNAASFLPPATIGAAQTAYDATLLDPPSLLDPAQTTNILLGTCRIWRGPITSTWSTSNAISPAFDGTATPCTLSSSFIRSIAAGGPTYTSTNPQLSGSSVLYAGLAGTLDSASNLPGAVFVTRTANLPFTPTSWSNIALNPVTNDTWNSHVFNPGGFDISSLAVDPHDPTGATVYATIMGFGTPRLYRSTDFGAHWLTLSANLPGAPANVVLIDPNDANTVYVALDTGVYVTQQINTCPTTSCWSILGTALPNSPVLSLAASNQLPTGDGRRGLLRAATYGRGIWQTPLLTAISLAQPAITLSTTNLTFAAQQVSTQSPTQTITVTSSGNAPVTFGTPLITGDFTETDTCTQQTLPINSTCTVTLTFTPTQTGPRSGLLTLYANILTGQATVTLTGTGTAPAAIVLSPSSLTFPATLVNQTTPAQLITVSNTGGNTATLQPPAITGDFAIAATTCTTSLAPSTSCTLSITFTPTLSGNRTGTLTLTDSIGTQTAALTGTGNAPATDTLSPTSLTFPQQQLNTTSPTQQITLTNSGDVPVTALAASITPGDFTVTNTCGTTLPAHTTCVLTVAFIPTATGTRTATLTLTDIIRTQTIPLTGLGVAPPGVSLSPATLTFPATGSGLTSLPQTATLTNNGGLPLTLTALIVSPNFVLAVNNCPTTLAVNTSCVVLIVFNPTTPGPLTGTFALTDNATSATQSIALTGLAVDFTLTPNGSTTATLASGSSATFPLLLTSLPTVTGTAAFACSGAPTNSLCTINPATPSLGATTPITVTVQTGIAALHLPSTPWQTPTTILFALLLPIAFLHRRTCKPLALVFLITLSACGAGREIPTTGPSNPSTPTPTGTYTLTISATSAGITHTVPLTLIVQ